jgi:tight adherence protein B
MRRRQVAQAWPEVLDSLVSASTSGFSVFDSLMELATSGPPSIRPYFKQLEKDIESGLELNVSLDRMRESMADLNVDRLVELVRVVSAAGGQGFYLALRNQAKQVREDLALRGELESKQGWVSGTAKVAILAPWLVVGMLCARQENVAAYSSYQGSTILIIGLVVSIFAYRLVQLLGSTSQPQRVFAK